MTCAQCEKPDDLCVCAALAPAPVRTSVLVLQHPQEPDVELGTGRILHLSLPGSVLRIGLSWPNLATAWGSAAEARRWAVLYLGSAELPPPGAPTLGFVDRKGKLRPPPAPGELLGLVVLDGTAEAYHPLFRGAPESPIGRTPTRPGDPPDPPHQDPEPRVHRHGATMDGRTRHRKAGPGRTGPTPVTPVDEDALPKAARPTRSRGTRATAGTSARERSPGGSPT